MNVGPTSDRYYITDLYYMYIIYRPIDQLYYIDIANFLLTQFKTSI